MYPQMYFKILVTCLMIVLSWGQSEDDAIEDDDAAENLFSGFRDFQPPFGKFWNQGGGAAPAGNSFVPWPLQSGRQRRPGGERGPQNPSVGGGNQISSNRPSIGFPDESGGNWNNQGGRPGGWGSNNPNRPGATNQQGGAPIWNGQGNQNQGNQNRPEEVEQLWGTTGPSNWGTQNRPNNRPGSQWGGNRPRPGNPNQGGSTDENPVWGSQPTFPNMGGNRPPVSSTNRPTTSRTTTSRIPTTSIRRPTTPTTSSGFTTESDGSSLTTTTLSPCERVCPVTPEFNPICTTTGNTYTNPGRLKCAQNCGKQETLSHHGSCSAARTTRRSPISPGRSGR